MVSVLQANKDLDLHFYTSKNNCQYYNIKIQPFKLDYK